MRPSKTSIPHHRLIELCPFFPDFPRPIRLAPFAEKKNSRGPYDVVWVSICAAQHSELEIIYQKSKWFVDSCTINLPYSRYQVRATVYYFGIILDIWLLYSSVFVRTIFWMNDFFFVFQSIYTRPARHRCDWIETMATAYKHTLENSMSTFAFHQNIFSGKRINEEEKRQTKKRRRKKRAPAERIHH